MKNIIKSKNPAQLLRIFTIFSLLSLIFILVLTNFGLHKIFVTQHVNETEHAAIGISKALFESKRELLRLNENYLELSCLPSSFTGTRSHKNRVCRTQLVQKYQKLYKSIKSMIQNERVRNLENE